MPEVGDARGWNVRKENNQERRFLWLMSAMDYDA